MVCMILFVSFTYSSFLQPIHNLVYSFLNVDVAHVLVIFEPHLPHVHVTGFLEIVPHCVHDSDIVHFVALENQGQVDLSQFFNVR